MTKSGGNTFEFYESGTTFAGKLILGGDGFNRILPGIEVKLIFKKIEDKLFFLSKDYHDLTLKIRDFYLLVRAMPTFNHTIG